MTALLLLTLLAGPPTPDGGLPARTLSDVRLLYFRASWCGSCAKFDAGGALEAVRRELPELVVEPVDADANASRMEQYGVTAIPALVLVDASGFPLARPRIELDAPAATSDRVVAVVRKMTKRRVP
jgi:hypothetical protein